MSQIVDDSRYWYDKAEECRVLADMMQDPIARSMMLNIAGDYERLADHTTIRAKIINDEAASKSRKPKP